MSAFCPLYVRSMSAHSWTFLGHFCDTLKNAVRARVRFAGESGFCERTVSAICPEWLGWRLAARNGAARSCEFGAASAKCPHLVTRFLGLEKRREEYIRITPFIPLLRGPGEPKTGWFVRFEVALSRTLGSGVSGVLVLPWFALLSEHTSSVGFKPRPCFPLLPIYGQTILSKTRD